VLIVKTSSLGDIVHMFPAVVDARREIPQLRLSWVVEEAFAPLVAMHPAVDDVITVSWRRWRSRLWSRASWREAREIWRQLGTSRYDDIVDTQGLIRSAVISSLANGKRQGYDYSSIRERPASLAYDARHHVPRGLHAIERNRRLTAAALGYAHDDTNIDYGLSSLRRKPKRPPYALLVRNTSAKRKRWPEESWIELGTFLVGRGLRVLLPSGNLDDFTMAAQTAALIPGAEALHPMPLEGIAHLIGGAHLVVGVDTGLLHLAAGLGAPLVGLFPATDPELTGPRGAGAIEVLGDGNGGPALADVIAASERILEQASC
jgi:heptosyltransferase-1